MRKYFRLFLHLLPILPLILGKQILFLAFLFMVTIPYIKTKKLQALIREHTENVTKDKSLNNDLDLYKKRLDFWQGLTFLNNDLSE